MGWYAIRPTVYAAYSLTPPALSVVTNATSTQGSERAVRLADEGFNVLAIGRDADLLASLLCRMSVWLLRTNRLWLTAT